MSEQYTISNVIFTSSNVVSNGFNNQLELNLAGSAISLEDCDIALAKMSFYNSVFNINSSVYGNNQFTVLLPYNNSGTLTWYSLNIVLPNGAYNYSDMNNYVQQQLISLGFYLINSTGSYVYPIQISANSVRYACQVDLSPCNSTLPAGWSYPSSGYWSSSAGLPTTAYTPQFVVSSSMSSVFGISVGTYPSSITTTQTSILSNFSPQISPVQSYFLRCSLVVNKFNSSAPDVLCAFTNEGTSIGQLITIMPNEYAWVSVPNQNISKITLTIVDQNFNFVMLQDPKITISLLLRTKK